MTDLFPFDDPHAQRAGASTSTWTPPPSVSDIRAVKPPLGLLAGAYAALLVVGLCFVLPGKLFNIAGYFIAVLGVTGLVIAFRTVDRKCRHSSTYTHISRLRWIAPTPLVLGIILAVVHAYFWAQSKSIA
jgi:hypothetical protein